MPNGNRCGGYQITNSLFCNVHSGGIPSKGTGTAEEIIKNPVCVQNYIGTLCKKAERGTLEPAVVNCITGALNTALKCMELTEYGTKLDMLMKQVQSVRGVRMVQDAECLDVEEDDMLNAKKTKASL